MGGEVDGGLHLDEGDVHPAGHAVLVGVHPHLLHLHSGYFRASNEGSYFVSTEKAPSRRAFSVIVKSSRTFVQPLFEALLATHLLASSSH